MRGWPRWSSPCLLQKAQINLELSAFLLNFATKKVARPNNEHKTIINSIHPAILAGHYGGGIRTAAC